MKKNENVLQNSFVKIFCFVENKDIFLLISWGSGTSLLQIKKVSEGTKNRRTLKTFSKAFFFLTAFMPLNILSMILVSLFCLIMFFYRELCGRNQREEKIKKNITKLNNKNLTNRKIRQLKILWIYVLCKLKYYMEYQLFWRLFFSLSNFHFQAPEILNIIFWYNMGLFVVSLHFHGSSQWKL